MRVDSPIRLEDVAARTPRVFDVAADKVLALDRTWDAARGAPVFTVGGTYTTRGWTEWTEGFQFGCAVLVYDATGDETFLHLGRQRIVDQMAPHVTHMGVHDHGFNVLSTYGNLRRLIREGRVTASTWETLFYELAIKASGAVQAARWSPTHDGGGYIYSFNGPHSLFVDTMRTLRVLALAHQLGHVLRGEQDVRISLLDRLIQHALTSARYLVWYGEDRDMYDIRGRTAHEAIFNPNNGTFRCPSSQQGYSPFSTWTRGLAWAMLGFAEQLEFLATRPAEELESAGGSDKQRVLETMQRAAVATCDFYIAHAACADGICYWDTGAPQLAAMGDYLDRPADPIHGLEPVDASAAAIAAQGLLRLANYLGASGSKYLHAGLAIARTLFGAPYLSEDPQHQGLLLHSIYHRPNGWDALPPGSAVPSGESSLWGDYHLLELALYVARCADPQRDYLKFFDA